MFEEDITTLLGALVAGELYWDELPDGYKVTGNVIIVQNAGGKSTQYVEKDARPGHKHTRLQVTVWGKRRDSVNVLARSVENTLVASAFPVEVMGAFVGLGQSEVGLKGTQQDFGIWYPDP